MTVIARKVAAEHRQTSHRDRRLACSCTWVADHYRDSDLGPFAQWARHIATQAEQAVRAHLAALYTARAAHARATSVAFTWQQAARTAGGEDRG